MLINPLGSDLAEPGDSIIDLFSDSLGRNRVRLRNNDIVVVSSKVVAISEKSLRSIADIEVTRDARVLAKKYSLPTEFVQIVLDESDEVLGGVKGAMLTLKNGDAVANAGADRKNAPRGFVVLWPKDPDQSARRLRAQIKQKFGRDVGIVIVDSRVTPLRLGTTGFAIGSAGFRPVDDVRGTADLSGRRVEITRHGVADGIAAAAQLVMGETAERRPFVVVREAPVALGRNRSIGEAKLEWRECLFMSKVIPASREALRKVPA